MTFIVFTALTLSLGRLAISAPSSPSRTCVNLRLSVPVKADNAIYDVPRADNPIEATDLIWEIERWTSPAPEDRIIRSLTVDQSFGISAQLCIPANSERANILQIATHGGGFSKSYWDVRLHPERYSYVDAALEAGYSVLTYDRLGSGDSEHPDAYEIVQGPTQVELLKGLIMLARDGALTKSIHGLVIPRFEKIVLVGHSIGSLLSLATIARYGDMVDGTVATGLIPGTTVDAIKQSAFGWEHAKTNDPKKFKDRGKGYLVQGTQSSLQYVFFKKGFFEPEMLAYAETIKDAATVGELLSTFGVLNAPADQYTGALLFAIAEYDVAICAGDCKGAYDPNFLTTFFPRATALKVQIQPGSGHAMTLHSNATGHYQEIFNYLKGNGL